MPLCKACYNVIKFITCKASGITKKVDPKPVQVVTEYGFNTIAYMEHKCSHEKKDGFVRKKT